MQPVVFVHGTRTSAAIWAEQMAALTRSGHDCLAVDLPGHGARRGETFTFAGALATIDRAVESFGTPPLVVGLSLGGYTSLAYAAENPGKVAGVLLSGCSTEIKGKPLGLFRTLAARAARTFAPHGTWYVVDQMLAAVRGYSSRADLRRLAVPVWVVNGRRDPLRWGERSFLAAHPAARLTVISGAGHDVPLHAPVAFARALAGAVAELVRLRVPVLPR